MNCRTCNNTINYNYETNCSQCGSAVDVDGLPKLDRSTGSVKRGPAWAHYLVNTMFVLVTSFVGMISGATVFVLTVSVLYRALASPETFPGQHCGRGMAIGMLSIIGGGFLGTVGGAIFSTRHLPAK